MQEEYFLPSNATAAELMEYMRNQDVIHRNAVRLANGATTIAGNMEIELAATKAYLDEKREREYASGYRQRLTPLQKLQQKYNKAGGLLNSARSMRDGIKAYLDSGSGTFWTATDLAEKESNLVRYQKEFDAIEQKLNEDKKKYNAKPVH